MTNLINKPALPAYALDYEAGLLTNTLTGEFGPNISGVVLAYREDRALYPTLGELPRLPLCVNGSEYGPCLCPFADFGPRGEAPDCSEELTLLLWMDDGAQVVTVTARRTMVKTIDQYLNMKALLGGILHDQRVEIRMTPDTGGLHRLTLLPGEWLDKATTERLAQVAQRIQASGAWEVL